MQSRYQSLDVLRGIAVLLVIGFHLHLPGIFRVGSVGVDLFFVLSGFLISGVLFKDMENVGRIRLRNFWFRRGLKILPPLYVFIAAMAALSFALHDFPGWRFLSAMFFFSNYLPDPNQAGALVSHTWSLAIEEHFYLIFPLLLVVLGKGRQVERFNLLPWIFVLTAIAGFVLRVIDPEHWAFTHLRVDALFAGVTLRYMERFRPQWFRLFQYPVAFLTGITFWVFPYIVHGPGPVFRSFIYTWTSFSAAFLVGWCFAHRNHAAWNLPVVNTIAAVGLSSYSIYLWQSPVCIFSGTIEPWWFFKPFGIVMSVGIGTVMARAVELPVLRLRDRMSSKERGTAETTSEMNFAAGV